MPVGKKVRKRATDASGLKIRVSIGFPSDVHETLDRIAKEKKVSLGWVVREAVDKYLADKWPLFAGK
jgi:predicted transcriptional regulator